MQFKYMGNDVIPFNLPSTKQELANSTDVLLEAIGGLDSLTLLNKDDIGLTMTLTCYEDVTPMAYKPPHYGCNDKNAVKIMNSFLGHSNHYLELGLLSTGFHTVKCRAKGDVFALDQSMSSSLSPDLEKAESTIVDSMALHKSSETNIAANAAGYPTIFEDVSELHDDDNPLEDANKTDVTVCHKLEIRCICKISFQFEHIELVECSQCSYFQHSVCIGYLHSTNVGDEYICQICEFGSYLNSDQMKCKQYISLCRLAIAYAYVANKVPEDVLNRSPSELKTIISQKLIGYKMISKTDGQLKVDVNVIEPYVKKYFKQSFNKTTKLLPDSINLVNDDDDERIPVDTNSKTKKRKYI